MTKEETLMTILLILNGLLGIANAIIGSYTITLLNVVAMGFCLYTLSEL